MLVDEPRHLGHYLGITLLVVFVGSVLSEALTLSLFSDNTADTLNNTALLRWATVMELCITSVGIVVLAALLYGAVKDQNPLLATLAFGCTIAEATILAGGSPSCVLRRRRRPLVHADVPVASNPLGTGIDLF